MYLYFLYPREDNIFLLLSNLYTLLYFLLPHLERINVTIIGKYYLLTPTKKDKNKYLDFTLNLPPLSLLNIGSIVVEEKETEFAFEFLNKTLFISKKYYSDFEEIKSYITYQNSVPTSLYLNDEINIKNFSSLESCKNIFKGKFPNFYFSTDKTGFTVISCLKKLLIKNSYIRFDDLSKTGNTWRIPLLNSNMYLKYISKLDKMENVGVETKTNIITFLECRRFGIECYYLDGIVYSKKNLPKVNVNELKNLISNEISKCKPNYDIFTLDKFRDLSYEEQNNIIQLKDNSCVTLSDFAIEWLILHPFYLDDENIIEYRKNSIIGFYDMIIGKNVIIPGSVMKLMYEEIPLDDINVREVDGKPTVFFRGNIVAERNYIRLSSFAKGYYVENKILPYHCIEIKV